MAFDDREKARILHHLGYPRWQDLAASVQLGFPSGAHPLFLAEQAFQRLTAEGEESVRADLCHCEDIERQLGTARERMKASQLGNLRVNPAETMQLRQELVFWRHQLADDLGVMLNPASLQEQAGMLGGLNAKVSG